MDPGTVFTPEQIAAITRSVGEAEGHTSGEIVPYVVGACDDYDDACWRGAVLAAVATAGAAAAVRFLGGFWGLPGPMWVALPSVAGAALGYLAVRTNAALRRTLIPDETLDLRARRRAMVAFVDEEVFATRDRTGVLLFVALFERRVVVLGDAGINRAVADGAWEEIVAALTAGIRAGRAADALADAIRACGRLLQDHRVERRSDDVNERADAPRLRER